MDQLKTVQLDGTPDEAKLLEVWVGTPTQLSLMSDRADGLIVFMHKAKDDPGQWSMSVSQSVSNVQLVQLLASLHDHCARAGLVAARGWQTPAEKPPGRGNHPREQKISIPLNSPNAAAQIQQALGPLMAKGTTPERIIDAAKAGRLLPTEEVPE